MDSKPLSTRSRSRIPAHDDANHVALNVPPETDNDASIPETSCLLHDTDADALARPQPVTTSYVTPSAVIFWLTLWIGQNVSIMFWNKKALSTAQLPVTLTFVHMVCNSVGAVGYIHVYKGMERQALERRQQQLMVGFSVIFVSNIVTGNWSLGLVSVSLNQVMRALVPAVVLVLSMLLLGQTYTLKRRLALVPIALGVYLACTGDNSCTVLGFVMTVVAILFAGLKVVLSNKVRHDAWTL